MDPVTAALIGATTLILAFGGFWLISRIFRNDAVLVINLGGAWFLGILIAGSVTVLYLWHIASTTAMVP